MPSPPDPQPVGYAPKLIGELTEGNLVVGGPSPNTMVDGGSAGAGGLADGSVTNAKLADMAAHTIKGNNLGSAGEPLDLTAAEVRTELGVGQYVVGFSFTGGALANDQLIGLHRPIG